MCHIVKQTKRKAQVQTQAEEHCEHSELRMRGTVDRDSTRFVTFIRQVQVIEQKVPKGLKIENKNLLSPSPSLGPHLVPPQVSTGAVPSAYLTSPEGPPYARIRGTVRVYGAPVSAVDRAMGVVAYLRGTPLWPFRNGHGPAISRFQWPGPFGLSPNPSPRDSLTFFSPAFRPAGRKSVFFHINF